jgi:F-type H+-transporting ATPase subunit b
MEILELFGVDWRLMIAQIINFAIVLFVLWRFAIKPLMKVMDERNKEISQGLDDAKQAAEKMEATEQEVKDKINQAKQETVQILEQAKQHADSHRQKNLAQTKEEVKVVIDKAKEQIEIEKQKMLADSKVEITELITKSLQKILSEGLSKELDEKYIAKTLKKLKSDD